MKHLIKIERTEHGSLSVQHAGNDMQWCEAGETVILEWQPTAGWGLQEAHYTKPNGAVSQINLTRRSFTMPASDITIGGTFKRFVLSDWTEGKGVINKNSQLFLQGENGEPVAIDLKTFALLFCLDTIEVSMFPVQSSVIAAALALKQNLLTSGVNIKTVNGISLLGSGNISVGGSDVALASLGFALFDDTQDYKAGDIVVYDDMLQVFNSDHSGAWAAADADPTTFVEILATGAIAILASDITPKSNTMQEFTQKFSAQTTGGDADLKSGPSALLGIKGNLDAQQRPFLADSFVSTGMNLVDPTQYITIVSKRSFIFPVVPGNWGAYGTTQENNGYIIIGGSVDSVYFSTTKPTSTSFGEACPYHSENGVKYYTPQAQGWMTIVCNTDDTPACHIAWSNYNDAVPGVFDNTVKDISTAVQWIHTWGLALVTGNGRTVFDEIDLAGGKLYRRTDRAALASLTWTREVIPGDTPTYVYTATLTGMAVNGAWEANYSGLEIDGNVAVIRTTSITSVEDLVTALAGKYVYFELATVASTTTSITTASEANDFGLTYFMYNGELVAVPAYVTEGFYQGGKDQLFNAVTYQKILAEVLAAAVCELDSRLRAIEEPIANGFNYLKAVNLEVTRKLVQPQ